LGEKVKALRLLVAGPSTIREVFTLRGHTREVTDVVFSPDGRYVVTGSKDGAAVLWPAVNISAVISVAQDDLILTPKRRIIAVAPNALVRDADAKDFAGATLKIDLFGSQSGKVARLQLAGTKNSTIRIENQQIRFHAKPNEAPTSFARMIQSADGTKLKFIFNQSADARMVSELVRAVRLDGFGIAKKHKRLQVRFKMTDKHDARSQTEDKNSTSSVWKTRSIRFRTPGEPGDKSVPDAEAIGAFRTK
ncbi:MAG: hypothetical protein IID45_12835, partial [Planctomycetes bacterium]|nr:hypothetical protein [Planctomycetota bacterium]